MRISTEALLMWLVATLYLFDSIFLFDPEEASLQRTRGRREAGPQKSRWLAGFGAAGWRLVGREPYLPNPFTPHRSLFRLRWRMEHAVNDSRPCDFDAVADVLAVFTPFVWLAALCVFALLPIALFSDAGTGFLYGVVLLIHLNNICALVLLFRRRATLNLSTRQFASIAFECVVCPPFAINLVRKVCARQSFGEDFVAAATRLMQPRDLQATIAACRRRIDEAIEGEQEGTLRMRKLLASRARFASPASTDDESEGIA